MRISKQSDYSFQGHLQKIYYSKDMVDERDVQYILSRFTQLNTAISYATPLLFVIDYTQSQYLLMTDTSQLITSYDPREFIESGIPMLIDIFHQDDFRIYNRQVFAENVKFLQSQPQHTHNEYLFSYNFRVRCRNGRFVPVWQRGCYITSKETGLPLYSLGMVIDIAPVKKDNVVCHTIEKVDASGGLFSKEIVVSNYFFPDEEDKILSRKEREVLACIADGLSGKQIAAKLKISENTVANHRKNLLKKTNTQNMAQLVSYACHSRLI